MAGMAAASNHPFVVWNIKGPIDGCVIPDAAIGMILAKVDAVNAQLSGEQRGIVVAPEFFWGKHTVYSETEWGVHVAALKAELAPYPNVMVVAGSAYVVRPITDENREELIHRLQEREDWVIGGIPVAGRIALIETGISQFVENVCRVFLPWSADFSYAKNSDYHELKDIPGNGLEFVFVPSAVLPEPFSLGNGRFGFLEICLDHSLGVALESATAQYRLHWGSLNRPTIALHVSPLPTYAHRSYALVM